MMAGNILMSTSACKALTLFSKVKSAGSSSGRFKASSLQQASSSEARDHFRSRDFVKLKQMDETYKLTKPGQKVLDLGAAPGSWSQYLAQKTEAPENGLVVAVDINNFESIKGVHTLPEMDFMKESSQKKVLQILGRGQKFDCIFSDIKPPSCGVKSIDEERMVKTVFYVYLFLVKHLKQGGSCVIKIQGAENDNDIKSNAKKLFKTVMFPETTVSSVSASEIYLIGKNFLGEKHRLRT